MANFPPSPPVRLDLSLPTICRLIGDCEIFHAYVGMPVQRTGAVQSLIRTREQLDGLVPIFLGHQADPVNGALDGFI